MWLLTNSLQRIGWLVVIEIWNKKYAFLLVFAFIFGYLLYTFMSTKDLVGTLIHQLSTTTRVGPNGTIYSYQFSNINWNTSNVLKFHISHFGYTLFLCGAAICSLLYSEYSNSSSKAFFISLPATLFEKWFAKVLIAFVFFPAVYLSIYQVFAQATYLMGHESGEIVKLGMFDPYVWYELQYYLYSVGLMILAAVYYRRYSIVKMGVTVLILYIVFNWIYNFFIVQIHGQPITNGLSYWSSNFANMYFRDLDQRSSVQVIFPDRVIVVLSFFALVLSYFKFKSLEA